MRDHTTRFTIGAEQIVKVDLDRHRLTLQRDGRTVRSIPVRARRAVERHLLTEGVVAPGNGFGAWNLSWGEWRETSALS